MKLDEAIGARLQACRQHYGWTRQEVSDRLGEGFSNAAIQAHEHGRNALKPAVALIYVNLYKIGLEWLFTGVGEMFDGATDCKIILSAMDDETASSWLDMGRRLAGQ